MYLPAPPISLADTYSTPVDRRRSLLALLLPDTVAFYLYVLRLVVTSRIVVALGKYDDARWIRASQDWHRFLENMGCRIEVEGMQHLREAGQASVIIANHMSTLETFLLPHMIHPILRCAYIIKPSLLKIPIAGGVFRAREPIVVTRNNPRQDLQIVLDEGSRRLAAGQSIIVFPQGTRSSGFDPKQFNSLGTKLARRANTPVIPVALKTDAWGIGRWIKDLGRFDRTKTVRIAFGAPLTIEGTGSATHAEVTEFISGKLADWGVTTQ